MTVKYVSIMLICSAEVCEWEYGSQLHDEMWQCLYEIAEKRPKYYENKTLKLVDCKITTSYKHEEQ
jgi:hypothetical protein